MREALSSSTAISMRSMCGRPAWKYCGCRTNVRPTFGRWLSSIHGPVPTTDSAFLRSPNFSTASRATMAIDIGLASISRNQAFTSLSTIRTV